MTIARALYHEPPVLIFGEATSALDSEAERVVKSNKTAPWKHGNAFVIARRLTTIRDANLICVLEPDKSPNTAPTKELLRLPIRNLHAQQLDR